MKIICIGKNYTEHVKEMGWQNNFSPALFLKPSSALCLSDKVPFPLFTKDLHHEIELVIKTNKILSNASLEDCSAAIEKITVGIDFTARDLQSQLKKDGMPWEKAKAFDNSAVIGTLEDFNPTLVYNFSLNINGKEIQKGNSTQMILNFAQVLQEASKYFTINPEDYIFTGTPQNVSSVKPNDILQGYLNNKKLFGIKIV